MTTRPLSRAMPALLGLLGLVALLGASGCAALAEDDAGTRIAAGFYPLGYVAERVAGDAATVEVLTAPGAEPHDLELTIRESAVIAGADLVVHEAGFQPAVDEGVGQNAGGTVLDAAAVVDLLPATEGGSDDVDPHFWLDPLRMADLGDAVAADLAQIDPPGADGYAERAAALRRDLEDLDATYAAGLADCVRHTVVVSHDAFGYLEKYGLRIAGVAGLSPDAEPTPADLGTLQALVTDEGVTTVFYERLASPRMVESLAGDLGLRTAVLDPLEGLTEATADEDYRSLMEQNLVALREANGCR